MTGPAPAWVESLELFGIKLGLERMRALLERLGHPERLRREVERAERMLANERFVANAPADVVEGEREKLERYRRELAALER